MSVLLSKLCRPVLCSRLSKTLNTHYRKEVQRQLSGSKSANKPAITWKSVTITCVFASGCAYYINNMREENARRQAIQRKQLLGKAAIGGQFELVDPEGKLRTSEEFKGQWLLIYFGFTHCPDICPDEIEKMVKTVGIINESEYMPNIQPIFISVDPERDTPEVVGKYIKEYSTKFIGLTGTPEQVDKVCKAFRVYYSSGPPDEDKDYIVDHTVIIYLINPDGDFVDYYGQTRSAQEVAEGIQLQMLKYEKMNKKSTPSMTSSLMSMIKGPDVVISKGEL